MVRRSDMVLSTEWAQVEAVDLVNDGNGLGFNLVGGRSTGVVIKHLTPGGAAERDGRLQSGDHVLQAGGVNLRGFTSEQVAGVLRAAGPAVRLLVARPADPASALRAAPPGTALVPTRLLADPDQLDQHLLEAGYGADYCDPYQYQVVAAAVAVVGDAPLQLADRPLIADDIAPAITVSVPVVELPALPMHMWVPNLPITIASAVCATAGVVCIFKDMYGGPPYERSVRADNKTVIITGATGGIGRAAAWDFATRGAKVFMACRDMEACEAARRDIVLETGNKFVYCRPCDLASMASVRDFVKRFKSEEPHCHVLVNNAGVMEPPAGVTRDGFQLQLAVNHLGHFLLTNLLLDTLKASAPSSVIVVSCSAHHRGSIDKADLNMSTKYDAPAAYAQSKLANVLFARELALRTLDSNVSVVAVDPGLTDTQITRHMSMMKSVSRFVVYPLFWPFMKTPKVGAQVILHAALDPAMQKCTGDYYVDMKKSEPSKAAQDYELSNWLWRVSEKWTRLDEHKAALTNVNAA